MRHVYALIILFISSIYATDTEYKLSGSVDYSVLFADKSNVHLADIVFNNDIDIGNNKVSISPGYFVSSSNIYNTVSKDYVNRISAVYLNEFYYSRRITNNLNVSIGHFSFRKGSLYEHGYNNKRVGDGIYSLTDTTLQGIIVSYTSEHHTYKAGLLGFDSLFKSFKDYSATDGSITYDSYKDSGFRLLSHSYRKDKIYLETQLVDIYQYINGNIITSTKAINLAGSYDDAEYSGTTYYGIVSIRKSNGDSSFLSPTGVSYSDELYNFNRFKTNSFYVLLGIKQELDSVIANRDIVIGAEVSHRSPGYHGLIAGRPISTFSYADIGTIYNIYSGYRINKDNILKVRYIHIDTDKAIKYGATPVHGSDSELRQNIDKDTVVLEYRYDF